MTGWGAFLLSVAVLLAAVLPACSLGLSPNGGSAQPLLIPVRPEPNGVLRAYRSEYWAPGNWIETRVQVRPSGEVTGLSHAVTGHRLFGCSVGVQAFLLDRTGRVLFHTRNFARGLDAQWIPSEAGHDRLLPLYDEQAPLAVVRDTAYIAIVHRDQSKSLAKSLWEKEIPLLRPLPYTLPEAEQKR
jgi:hypothetical protein